MMSYRQKEHWKLVSIEWQPSGIYYFKPFSYCFTSQDLAIKDKSAESVLNFSNSAKNKVCLSLLRDPEYETLR